VLQCRRGMLHSNSSGISCGKPDISSWQTETWWPVIPLVFPNLLLTDDTYKCTERIRCIPVLLLELSTVVSYDTPLSHTNEMLLPIRYVLLAIGPTLEERKYNGRVTDQMLSRSSGIINVYEAQSSCNNYNFDFVRQSILM